MNSQKKINIIITFTILFFSALYRPHFAIAQPGTIETDRIILNKLFKIASSLQEDNQTAALMNEISQMERDCLDSKSDSVKAFYNYLYGGLSFKTDNYETALNLLLKAKDYFENLSSADCLSVECVYYIGQSYLQLGDLRNAEVFLQKAMIRAENLEGSCIFYDQICSSLIDVYISLNHKDLADQVVLKQEQFMRNLSNSRNWEQQVDAIYELIESYMQSGNNEKVIECYNNILEVIDTSIGKNNEDYILYMDLLALFYENQLKDFNMACIQYRKLIETGKSITNPNENIAWAYFHYMYCLASTNNTEELANIMPIAIAYITQTPGMNIAEYLRISDIISSPLGDLSEKASFMDYWGFILLKAEKAQAASKIFVQYITLIKDNLGDSVENLCVPYHNLGRCHMLQNNWDEALQYLETSKELQLKFWNEVIPNTTKYIDECKSQIR